MWLSGRVCLMVSDFLHGVHVTMCDPRGTTIVVPRVTIRCVTFCILQPIGQPLCIAIATTKGGKTRKTHYTYYTVTQRLQRQGDVKSTCDQANQFRSDLNSRWSELGEGQSLQQKPGK